MIKPIGCHIGWLACRFDGGLVERPFSHFSCSLTSWLAYLFACFVAGVFPHPLVVVHASLLDRLIACLFGPFGAEGGQRVMKEAKTCLVYEYGASIKNHGTAFSI